MIRLICLCCLALAGCSSVRTTFLKTNSAGEWVESPDMPRRGIPTMVQVPTHVDVKIIQTDVWKVEDKDGADKKLKPLPKAASRKVTINEITTGQMVMIDPKRPLSGSGEFGLD